MSQTLKELLKPPYYNPEGDIIGNKYITLELSLNEETEYKPSEIADWITTALNEKYERYFAEPMRWIIANVKIAGHIYPYACPYCKYAQDNLSNYCPNCGQKPDEPE